MRGVPKSAARRGDKKKNMLPVQDAEAEAEAEVEAEAEAEAEAERKKVAA